MYSSVLRKLREHMLCINSLVLPTLTLIRKWPFAVSSG